MRVYHERLGVPLWWWLAMTACVLLLGTTLWAGLSPGLAIAIYAVLEGGCALILAGWGAAVIEVTDSGLMAGGRRLPIEQIGQVTALDATQTAALRGPRADPAAYLLARPYLAESVYVEVSGRPPEPPYWLVATRRPAALAAAIEQVRPTGRAPDLPDGDPVTRSAPDAVG